MSAATAKARPAARPELRREEVREFHVVEGTRPRRSVVAILMLLVAVALASVLASMVLNTRMAQTSFFRFIGPLLFRNTRVQHHQIHRSNRYNNNVLLHANHIRRHSDTAVTVGT